jgi:hypothetical protein
MLLCLHGRGGGNKKHLELESINGLTFHSLDHKPVYNFDLGQSQPLDIHAEGLRTRVSYCRHCSWCPV